MKHFSTIRDIVIVKVGESEWMLNGMLLKYLNKKAKEKSNNLALVALKSVRTLMNRAVSVDWN